MCACCHREISGTPFEKNGYLYDSEEHANAVGKESSASKKDNRARSGEKEAGRGTDNPSR